MPKYDSFYKLSKTTRFLIASNDPRIFALLNLRGYTNEVRHEGWDLAFKAGGRFVDMQSAPPGEKKTSDLLRTLDEFENAWFDVIDAALRRASLAVHDMVVLNLHKSSGQDVVLTMKTLLDRIDEIEKQPNMQPLIDLLTSRGFSPAVRAGGRRLLAQVAGENVTALPVPDPVAEAERLKAEEDMWSWYQDWAKTARTVVRRKDLRIRLGISSPTSREAEPEEEPTPIPQPSPQAARADGANA